MQQSPRALLALAAVAVVAAACGGGGTPAASPSPSASAAASPSAPIAPSELPASPQDPSAATTEPAESTTDQEEATEVEPTEDDAAGGTRPADGEEMAGTDFDAIFSEQLDAPDMDVPAEEEPTEDEPAATEEATDAGSPATDATGGSEDSYGSYTVVTDDSGTISVAIPEAWTDVDGAPIEESGLTIYDVRASTDLAAFQSSWTTPGVIVTALADPPEGVTVESVLEEVDGQIAEQCESVEERQPYSDQLYTGLFDVYSGCGDEGATYVAVGAEPADQSSIIRVQVQVNAERDLEALDAVLQSFTFNGATN